MRQAGHLLGGVGERRVVGPTAGQPETGHREHNQLGVDRPQVVPGQAEVPHHARGVVLDQDVGLFDHRADRVRAAPVGQIERDALLVAVDPVELRRGLPELGNVDRAAGPPAVDPLHRFDLDHVGPGVGEDHRGHRPRHKHREVDHAQAFKRALDRLIRGFGRRWRPAAPDIAAANFLAVLIEQRRRRAAGPLLAEHPGRPRHPHAPGARVVELEKEAALAVGQQIERFGERGHQPEGNAPGLRLVKDFVRGAVARQRGQLVGQLARVLDTPPDVGELRIFDQLGASEKLAHHFPLRLGQRVRADVAVAGWQDERWRGADIGAARAQLPGVLVALGDEQRHIDGGFEHADIDMFGLRQGLRLLPAQRNQRGDGGVSPGQGFGNRAAQLQRLALGAPAEMRKTANRAGDQVVPLPVGVRPVRAEARHGDQNDRGVERAEVVEPDSALRQLRFGLAGDHDLRVANQRVAQTPVVGIVRIKDNSALTGVGIKEGRTGLGIDSLIRKRPTAARSVAAGRLNLDHVSPKVAKQLGRKWRRQPLPKVDDAQSAKRRRVCHSRSSMRRG